MIPFTQKKYRYTFYFSGFEWEFTSICTPDNMHHDFNEGEVVNFEFNYSIYLVDFSKVNMIKCQEEIDFKDLPKEEK